MEEKQLVLFLNSSFFGQAIAIRAVTTSSFVFLIMPFSHFFFPHRMLSARREAIMPSLIMYTHMIHYTLGHVNLPAWLPKKHCPQIGHIPTYVDNYYFYQSSHHPKKWQYLLAWIERALTSRSPWITLCHESIKHEAKQASNQQLSSSTNRQKSAGWFYLHII